MIHRLSPPVSAICCARGIATGHRSYLTGWRNWRRSRRRINLPAPRCCSPRRKDASLCRRRVYWRRPAILNKRSPATTSCLKVIRRRANWRSNTGRPWRNCPPAVTKRLTSYRKSMPSVRVITLCKMRWRNCCSPAGGAMRDSRCLNRWRNPVRDAARPPPSGTSR